MLSREREKKLAIRWRRDGDERARDELVRSHLKLVLNIARRFLGYNFPLDVLVQEGNKGLLEAVDRFDPRRNVRFNTYARVRILSSVRYYVLDNFRIVRGFSTIPLGKTIFFNLARWKHEEGILDPLSWDGADKIIRKYKLNIAPNALIAYDCLLTRRDSSLNAPAPNSKNNVHFECIDLLEDNARSVEEVLLERDEFTKRREALYRTLEALSESGKLSERDKVIYMARKIYGPPRTLYELANRFGISRERVRQIETRTHEKVVGKMRKIAPELFAIA